jgi:hypothetical protein
LETTIDHQSSLPFVSKYSYWSSLLSQMKQKEVIFGTLIGLGALFGLGLLYKYYKKPKKEIPEKKKTSELTGDSTQEKNEEKILKSLTNDDLANIMQLLIRKKLNQSFDEELLKKYEKFPNFDSELMILVLNTREYSFTKYLNNRMESGIFNGEATLNVFYQLGSLKNESPEMESIHFHYFKLCIPLILEEIKKKPINGMMAFALSTLMIFNNVEHTKFVFDFCYKLVIENMNQMSLENNVWGFIICIIQNLEVDKKNILVKAIVNQNFPFNSNWLNFYRHTVYELNFEQMLYLVSTIVKNKELLKDEESLFIILSFIQHKMDITNQLKKLFKTLYPFKKVYYYTFDNILEPETYEDATLMIPYIKEMISRIDLSDRETMLSKDQELEFNQGAALNLSSKMMNLLQDNSDILKIVDFGYFLLNLFKSESFVESLSPNLMNHILAYYPAFSKLGDSEAFKTALLVSMKKLSKSDPRETNSRIVFMGAIMGTFQFSEISLTFDELRDYILMTIKLLKNSTDEEIQNVNLLTAGIFVFNSVNDSIIGNFMTEIGEIINICASQMGKFVGMTYDATWMICSFTEKLKNRVWPWREVIFKKCLRVLKKNKWSNDEHILTHTLSILSYFIDFFEEQIENLVSTPGFLDLILHFSIVYL